MFKMSRTTSLIITLQLLLRVFQTHGVLQEISLLTDSGDFDRILNNNNGSDLATTKPTPVTIGPAHKVKYTLTLTHPGPSILDSTLSFFAELVAEDGQEVPKNMNFSYLWMNMADMEARRTDGHYRTELSLSFPSEIVDPGDYTMTVVASEENKPSKILAFQTRKFVLTEKLNGHLHITQDLDYQRLNNTFATGEYFEARAILLDKFTEQSPHYEFIWYEGDKFIFSSHQPLVLTKIDVPKNFSLRSVVLATMAIGRTKNKEEGPGSRKGSERDRGPKETPNSYVKNGDFQEFVYFKDPLTTCYTVRVDTNHDDRDVKIGTPAIINITCEGSTPTAVCLNTTTYNASASNLSCTPGTFVDSLHHQVKVNLNQTGWNDVHFYVFNDVSRHHFTIAFYAYDPKSTDIPALVLPIVFVTLGIVVIICGSVYTMRLRKKPLVEVADFDFHPELNESETGGSSPGMRLSLVANTIKYLLTRHRWSGYRRSAAGGVPSTSSNTHAGSAWMEDSLGQPTRTGDDKLLYDSL